MGCAGVSIVSNFPANTPPPPVDPGGWTPRPMTNNTGVTIPAFSVCYIVGNNLIALAQSDGTEAEAYARCITLEDIANGATGDCVMGGAVDGAGAGKTFGQLGYLSTTPGAIANAPNLTAGQYMVILGWWLNATDFQFSPQIPILN